MIGVGGTLPWHIPEDLAWFKQQTIHKTVVMGRKTWLSLGKALPNRRNIVLTHRLDFTPEQAETIHHVEDVIELAKHEDLFIIGGAELFATFLPYADYLYLSYIDASFDGDTYFPTFDKENWSLIQVIALSSQAGYRLRFCVLKR